MSTLNVTFFGAVTAEHVEQLFQHTTGNTNAVVPTVNDLFVNPPFVTVQDVPAVNASCTDQLSAANLYSYVPGAKEIVVSQTPSPLASVNGLHAAPHQPLKVPLTSGVVKPDIWFMSTLKVTLV